jgi:hypothetical protein
MVEIGGFTLSITTRHVGDNVGVMKELTLRTIGAFLHLAGKIQRQEFDLTETEGGSVESRYLAAVQKDFPDAKLADAWGDARVTIWDKKGLDFHLNSDDDFQAAIDTWKAHKLAIQEALEKFTPPARQDATAQPAPTNERPATPKAQNAPASGAAPLLTKKEAIAKLQPGDPFRMKVVQIERHSKDGQDYYDFFEPWGGKAGQYSAKTIYADNEIAQNNGLIAYLESLGVKLGQALTGNWIVNATVGKPKTKTIKGEEKTYTDIYINSFEGQPEPV